MWKENIIWFTATVRLAYIAQSVNFSDTIMNYSSEAKSRCIF